MVASHFILMTRWAALASCDTIWTSTSKTVLGENNEAAWSLIKVGMRKTLQLVLLICCNRFSLIDQTIAGFGISKKTCSFLRHWLTKRLASLTLPERICFMRMLTAWVTVPVMTPAMYNFHIGFVDCPNVKSSIVLSTSDIRRRAISYLVMKTEMSQSLLTVMLSANSFIMWLTDLSCWGDVYTVIVDIDTRKSLASIAVFGNFNIVRHSSITVHQCTFGWHICNLCTVLSNVLDQPFFFSGASGWKSTNLFLTHDDW